MHQPTPTQPDLAQLRQVVLNLSTAVAGILDIMEAEATPSASPARLRDLTELREIAVDCCHQLEPEDPFAR